MTRRIGWAVALIAVAVLSGCAGGPVDRRTQGVVLGGATGAAIGSLFGAGRGRAVATGLGAVLGAIAGSELADRREYRYGRRYR